MKFEIFIINLARSKSRWESISARLDTFSLVYQRVDAIDGKSCDPEKLEQHYSPEINRKTYHRPLTAGEIGCYLSHINCWERIIDSQLDFALILEDDAVPSDILPEIIRSTQHYPPGWDVIKLATGPRQKEITAEKLLSQIDLSVVSFAKIPSTATAQLVSVAGAQKLLSNRKLFGRPVDVDIQFFWEAGLKIFGLRPFPVHVDFAFESDISQIAVRRSDWRRRWRRLQQRFEYEVKNRRHRGACLRAIRQ